jgi:hypothetical protein
MTLEGLTLKEIAHELRRSESAVGQMRVKCGVHNMANCERGWFKPGQMPANKGVKRPGWSVGRMRETQFKAGQMNGRAAQIWKPLWSDRLSKDGYLEIKVRERKGRYGNWVPAHILIWEDKHGPIPHGHKLVFRDGDKAHIVLGNLELISNAEMMRRNTIHNRYPKEMVNAIMLLGAVKRKLRERRAKEHDDGSAQPSV